MGVLRQKSAAIAMDPFTAVLNVASNAARTSTNPIVEGVYDKMSRSSVRSGLQGVPTRDFMRGVFGASPLSQPLDPVLTAEDIGASIRKILLSTPEAARPALFQQIQAMASPENIAKIPSEYRPGLRSIGKLDADEVLSLIQKEGRKALGPVASRGAYMAGTALGALMPQPQPAGQLNQFSMLAANAPWVSGDIANAAANQAIKSQMTQEASAAAAKPRRPNRFSRMMGNFSKNVIGGLVDGVSDPTPTPELQRRAGRALSFLVAPSVRSAVEQAHFALDPAVSLRQQVEPAVKNLLNQGYTVQDLVRNGKEFADSLHLGDTTKYVGNTAADMARSQLGKVVDTVGNKAGDIAGSRVGETVKIVGNTAGDVARSQLNPVINAFGNTVDDTAKEVVSTVLSRKPSENIKHVMNMQSLQQNTPMFGSRSRATASLIGEMADSAVDLTTRKKPSALYRIGKFIGRGMRGR